MVTGDWGSEHVCDYGNPTSTGVSTVGGVVSPFLDDPVKSRTRRTWDTFLSKGLKPSTMDSTAEVYYRDRSLHLLRPVSGPVIESR